MAKTTLLTAKAQTALMFVLIFAVSMGVPYLNEISLSTSALDSFTDVPQTHDYFKTIDFLREQEVIRGYSDGSFLPDKELTRAEFMKIILLGMDIDVPEAQSAPFTDVPLGEWFTNDIAYGSSAGYLQGYGDGTFLPHQSVTRAEAMKILGELAGWDLSSVDTTALSVPYSDLDLNDWHGPYFAYAISHNLLDDSGTLLKPSEPITRGQMTEYLFRDYVVRELGLAAYDEAYDQEILDSNLASGCGSRALATEIVLSDVVQGSAEEDEMIVYLRDQKIQPGDTFSYYLEGDSDTEEAEPVVVEMTEDAAHWFFWLDLQPTARFDHNTKIATVEAEHCTLTLYDAASWPTVNDEELWSTDVERNYSPSVAYRGSFAPARANIPDPATISFADCNADASKKREAIILYIGYDYGVKLDAIQMKAFLCGLGYNTVTLHGVDVYDTLNEMEDEFARIKTAVATAGGGLNAFAFYTISHGRLGDGWMVFPESHNLSPTIFANKFRDHVFGTSDITAETYTIVHDTCYSGKVVRIFQKAATEAHNSGLIGWVGTSSGAAEVTWSVSGTDLTSNYRHAIEACLTDWTAYNTLQECLVASVHASTKNATQNPQMEKLTTSTGDSTPFLP